MSAPAAQTAPAGGPAVTTAADLTNRWFRPIAQRLVSQFHYSATLENSSTHTRKGWQAFWITMINQSMPDTELELVLVEFGLICS